MGKATRRGNWRKSKTVSAWLKSKRELNAAAGPTSPRRTGPGSVTSFPVKQHDPETAALIAEWERKQAAGVTPPAES